MRHQILRAAARRRSQRQRGLRVEIDLPLHGARPGSRRQQRQAQRSVSADVEISERRRNIGRGEILQGAQVDAARRRRDGRGGDNGSCRDVDVASGRSERERARLDDQRIGRRRNQVGRARRIGQRVIRFAIGLCLVADAEAGRDGHARPWRQRGDVDAIRIRSGQDMTARDDRHRIGIGAAARDARYERIAARLDVDVAERRIDESAVQHLQRGRIDGNGADRRNHISILREDKPAAGHEIDQTVGQNIAIDRAVRGRGQCDRAAGIHRPDNEVVARRSEKIDRGARRRRRRENIAAVIHGDVQRVG